MTDKTTWPNNPYLPRTPFSAEYDRLGFALNAEDRELRALFDQAKTLEQWTQIQDDWRNGRI